FKTHIKYNIFGGICQNAKRIWNICFGFVCRCRERRKIIIMDENQVYDEIAKISDVACKKNE
ncbi:MAG: hypothetical protein NC453_29170, partial [Muribaculum sp.]|nr:hypothetical protein [Muribaculum sp.]